MLEKMKYSFKMQNNKKMKIIMKILIMLQLKCQIKTFNLFLKNGEMTMIKMFKIYI